VCPCRLTNFLPLTRPAPCRNRPRVRRCPTLGAGANHRMRLLVFEDGRIAAARQSVGPVLLFELSGNATALRATVASIRQRPPSGERTGS
jgi:hypothetical protein